MDPLPSFFAFLIALVSGAFGSVLGIGGGLFIIPSLTLFLFVPLKTAIAASVIAVIATSLGGGNRYVRQHLADIRLGLLLALATAPGAVVGALVATHVSARVLAAVFALVLLASAYRMVVRGGAAPAAAATVETEDRGLQFKGEYLEPSTGEAVRYRILGVPFGVGASALAGLISGMLGVGGGIIQVPVMSLVMRAPIKVAAATSTYIIGITAMAGAFVYYNHRPSFVDPSLAVPVTLGVFLGSQVGSRVLSRISQVALRRFFTVVLVAYTIQMVLRVFGIG
ncbi:MAG: sulfite exporter TauE/SafE family protein [Chloroflexota bacterium]